MEQRTEFQHVTIEQIAFLRPAEQICQKVVREKVKSAWYSCIVLIACAVVMSICSFLIHPAIGLIVMLLFGLVIWCQIHDAKQAENIGIRYGTIVDYYSKIKKVRSRRRGTESSELRHYITVRLDDSRQIVHDIRMNAKKISREPIGAQVALLRYGNSGFAVRPAEDLDPPPVQTVQDMVTPGTPHETTIDRVTPEPAEPALRQRVCRKEARAHLGRRMEYSVLLLALLAVPVLPLWFLLEDRPQLRLIVFSALIAALIVFHVLMYLKDLRKPVSSILVQILEFHPETLSVDFLVTSTEQIVRQQRLLRNECGSDPTGDMVMLVRNSQHNCSIYPID